MPRTLCIAALLAALLFPRPAPAAPDAVELAIAALLDGNVPELQRLLAPNFVFVGSNGHVQDKDHFLDALRSGSLKVSSADFRNVRETAAGEVRLLTGNGVFSAASDTPLPGGLMRVSIVSERNGRTERIVLVQLTPVVPTRSCPDGNCRIR